MAFLSLSCKIKRFAYVKQYFDTLGLGQRVMVLAQSSATVEEAAVAVGCEPERIAKTMSFLAGEEAILIVTAGDAKVDNKKYKENFHHKAKMIPGESVEQYIGHAPGGVCPFAIPPGTKVYLDVSLKRFDMRREQVTVPSNCQSRSWKIALTTRLGLTCARGGGRNKPARLPVIRESQFVHRPCHSDVKHALVDGGGVVFIVYPQNDDFVKFQPLCHVG